MKARYLSDKPRLVFFISYTLLYLLAVQAAAYVTPFILAVLIAVVMKPLYDMLRRRFCFQSTFAATTLTLLIFGAVFAVIGFLLYLVVRQALSLMGEHRDTIAAYLRPTELSETLREHLFSGDLFSAASSVIKVLFQAIPLMITFVIVTFAVTVFLLHHLENIRDKLLDRAGEYRDVLHRIFHIGYGMIRRFIRSYLILYAITFFEASLIFTLTGVPYPLAYAFITAVADILPILGPGTVYVPFAVFFILQKNYMTAVLLLLFFLLTVVIRQIIEPRIVSDSIKIHPLIILAAIYISLVCMNIWVLFYVISVLMLYRVLDAAGVFEKTAPTMPSKG